MTEDRAAGLSRRLRNRGRGAMRRFFQWYERHYVANLTITTLLFALQLVHLYWLTTHVVALRLTGESIFTPTPFWQYVIILVDYTEIPALVSTSILYLYQLSQRFSVRYVWFLFSLNIQWLHLFWITDEFVVSQLLGAPVHQTVFLPAWLAWIALFIDYLELPVIVDTFLRLARAIATGRLWRFLHAELKYHIWHL